MNDQFTSTTTTGWGSRIINSIKGIVFGLLLFVVSFGVLYWNEGRVDLSNVAETAIEINATAEAEAEMDKKLVSSTGELTTDEMLGDTYLQEGKHISIQRKSEMYAWVENTETETEKNTGGSETTTTTYNYTKQWTESPTNSSNFKYPEGHDNPQKSINSSSNYVTKATLGIYDFDLSQIELFAGERIPLTEENIILEEEGEIKRASRDYLFKGIGTIDTPKVGDIRISYYVVNPVDTATVFGMLSVDAKKISPYYGPKNTKLYRIFKGTRETAISTMKTEHKITTWILRAVGFFMMWFGLMMLFGPISVILDVLPFLGSVSRGAIGLVTFLVSLVLSGITILISMIVHSVIALIITIVVAVIAIIIIIKRKNKTIVGQQGQNPPQGTSPPRDPSTPPQPPTNPTPPAPSQNTDENPPNINPT